MKNKNNLKISTKNLNYQNITISGLPGAGSSTLGKALANLLGFSYFSGGDFMRAYAIEKGLFKDNTKAHHDATVYSQDFDRQVDLGMRDNLKNKKGQILDSWLSGFMAQGVPGVLKILVTCSDDAVRVDRIVNRDQLTVDQAKHHIFDREEKNTNKWRALYKNEWDRWIVKKNILSSQKEIWFWYEELYDLTIDTYKNSKQETLKRTLKKLGYNDAHLDYDKIF